MFYAEASDNLAEAVIGETILTPYPEFEDYYSGNTRIRQSTFIVYKIEYWTNGNDFKWYNDMWSNPEASNNFNPCKQRKEETDYLNGLNSDYDDTGYWNFLAQQNHPTLPIDQFKPYTQVEIPLMEDYETFLDKKANSPNDVNGYPDKVIPWS